MADIQFKQVEALQEGKAHYLAKDDNIVSKKQLSHDAKNTNTSLADTYSQVGYWIDVLTNAHVLRSLDPYTLKRFIWDPDSYLRAGYIDRRVGKVYPYTTPTLPEEPYQGIYPKTSPRLKQSDDLTGRGILKLTASIETEFARGSESFIDLDDYAQFVNMHAEQVGAALGTQLTVASSLYCMSHYPCSTMCVDPDIAPFLDDSLRPDENTSPGAHKHFDKNGDFWKFMLKEIFGESQRKLTNIGYYSVRAIASTHDKIEISQPTRPTPEESDTKTANIFTQKVDEKYYTHNAITPYACGLALSRAIKDKWRLMTTSKDPKNMGSYKPYQTTAQTDAQMAIYVPPNQLEIILHPSDYAYLTESITNTSPDGNYPATIASVIAAGTQVFSKDTMLPGFFIIQQIGTYLVVKILEQTWELNFDWCLAHQQGAHMFTRYLIRGHNLFYKGIPDNWLPPPEVMYHHFSSIKAS